MSSVQIKDAPCMTWRPVRLVAENRARLVRAVVEETPTGWVWSVTRGTSVLSGPKGSKRLSKAEAIEEASRAMMGERAS